MQSAWMSSDFWVGAAAVATAGTAVVIAYQSYWTKEAVKEARDATQVASTAVREQIRARLDSVAPTLTVVVTQSVSVAQPSDIGQPMPLAPGQTFVLPRQGREPILMRALVLLRNESNTVLPVQLAGFVEQSAK
jgi:hypothetical protein